MRDQTQIHDIEYSVVVPVYKGQSSIEELCVRTDRVFRSIEKNYEIILVDDCSPDSSWEVMKKISEIFPTVKIIQLMKNFGQHNAIICGMHYAQGAYIITMDDDLQNPPEEIPKLIEEMSKGFDCVIGALEEKKDTIIKKLGSLFIRYLNTKIFKKPKNLKLSSYRIMTRKLSDEIKILKTPYPYITGMILSLTRNIGNVYVKHDQRKYGRSNYNIKKLLRLSLNLLINYTSIPMDFLIVVGGSVSFISFFLGLYFIVKKVFLGVDVPGWTSLVVLLSFMNGVILSILSVMGQYLLRIIGEISNRRQFVVRTAVTK